MYPIRYRLTDAGYVDTDHQWNAVVFGVQLMDLPEHPDAINLGPEIAGVRSSDAIGGGRPPSRSESSRTR